jgi:hypothetical protein
MMNHAFDREGRMTAMAGTRSEEERLAVFRRVRDDILDRIRGWLGEGAR